jgi:hypothetical protein
MPYIGTYVTEDDSDNATMSHPLLDHLVTLGDVT